MAARAISAISGCFPAGLKGAWNCFPTKFIVFCHLAELVSGVFKSFITYTLFMRTIKIQLPLISWIFILLDISLFCFQFVRVYFHPGEGRHWRATMLCLLAIIYNCISGNLLALWVHISINVAVLFLVVYLLTKKVRDVSNNKEEEPPAETPDIPFQMLEITEAMAAVFLENCHLFQFTAREIDVCLLLAKGMTYTEIAETLHISNSTVDSHAQKIYKKSGVNSRVTLLHKLYQNSVK